MGSPVSNHRISGPGTPRSGQKGAPAGAAVGNRRGIPFTVVQKADRRKDHDDHDLDAERLPDPAQRLIWQHAVVPEERQPLPPPRELMNQIRQAERSLREPGFALHVRQHARALLKGAQPPRNPFRRPASGVARQLALKLAASCAAAGLDTDSIAAVTPVEFEGEGFDDFRRRMGDILKDREQLEKTVEEIAPGLKGEARDDFERQLYQSGRMDSPQFAVLLRDAQELPSGYTDIYKLADELAGEELEHRLTEDGVEATAFLAQLAKRAMGVEVGALFAKPVEQGERGPGFCDVARVVARPIPKGELFRKLPAAIDELHACMAVEIADLGRDIDIEKKNPYAKAASTVWDGRVVRSYCTHVEMAAGRIDQALAAAAA